MKLITQEVIHQLVDQATAAPRRRSNLNFHPVLDDPVQRLLVAAKVDTYFRPHRHETRWEFALVLQGAFDIFFFDDGGVVTGKLRLGRTGDALGFEMPPRTWHGWLPVEDDSVFFEVKQGPYDPVTGTTFAAWAPPEGDAAVAPFLARLRSARVGDRMAG
jgi:cupin fold WbuC family metalloprotein